ncbi:MAG TPA: hypothetical protein VGF21_01910 [Thermoleophilaceae bacterium]|jgi:hypothetical protein
MRSALLVAVFAAVALAVMPTSASAGTFAVLSCFDDPSQQGLAFDATLDSAGMGVKPACQRQGPGLRGMITYNTTGRRPAARGALARTAVYAPDGTYFESVRWWGQHRRADCRYAIEAFADNGQGGDVHTFQKLAPRASKTSCLRHGRPQKGFNADPSHLNSAGDPKPHWWRIGPSARIVQQIKCAAPRGQRCSRRSLNYLRTYGITTVVNDPNPPAISITGGGALYEGRWVHGSHTLSYSAADNVGIRSVSASVLADAKGPESELGTDRRPCSDAQPSFQWAAPAYRDQYPCGDRNVASTVPVDTINVGDGGEGTRTLVLRAADAGNNITASEPITVRIDRTPPAKVGVEVEGGEAWHNSDRFALIWSNSDNAGDVAPIDGVFYQSRPTGSTDWSEPKLAAGSISRLEVKVPEGQSEVRLWRRDEADNASQGLGASDAVTLRYDGTAPELAFETQTASDPTRVTVAVTDRVSGLAGGSIEIRREGTDVWQALPTQQESSRLVARVDDAALPPGQYVARAKAFDQARNEASTERRLDGQPMVLSLPLRGATKTDVGVAGTKTVRTRVRRHGRRRVVRRRVHVLDSRVRASLGHRVRLTGVLTAADGSPLANQAIQIYGRSRTDAAETSLGAVTTDADGRYTYLLPAGPSRSVRFVFAGTALLLPSQHTVRVLVSGASTIRAAKRKILNGQTVTFRGRVRSLPIPPGGKNVELQVWQGRRQGWTTFRTFRTDASGHWAKRYTFSHTTCLDRWRIRVRVPREAGYPFEDGASRSLRITVRGRC